MLVVLTFGLLAEAKLWRPNTRFTITENVQIGEAEAWWNGQLDLPQRQWDTAERDGRVFSYFPPMFTIIASAIVMLFDGVPHGFIVLALVLPTLLLAYVVFLKRTESPLWGALLAIGFLCGTSMFPVTDKALRGASPYHVNHMLATIGLLLILHDYFGPRRVWLAGVGLALAALSRQLTIVYALPIAAMCLWCPREHDGWKRLAWFGGACLFFACLYGALNTAKFGHPLRTGYMLNHEGRDDVFARKARA